MRLTILGACCSALLRVPAAAVRGDRYGEFREGSLPYISQILCEITVGEISSATTKVCLPFLISVMDCSHQRFVAYCLFPALGAVSALYSHDGALTVSLLLQSETAGQVLVLTGSYRADQSRVRGRLASAAHSRTQAAARLQQSHLTLQVSLSQRVFETPKLPEANSF